MLKPSNMSLFRLIFKTHLPGLNCMVPALFSTSERPAGKQEPYRDLLKSKKQIQLDMVLRDQKFKNSMHPALRERYNQFSQKPEPLKYKLQDLPENHDPLVPLGNTAHLPFHVQRTKSENLPVYRDYRRGRHTKMTIIRRISGDFEELMAELKKVCSNADVESKVGKIIVRGLHKHVVIDYLTRLGF